MVRPLECMAYNANSSIMSLQRSGKCLQGPAIIDNVTFTKLTSQLRETISDRGHITYTYDYERLKEQ